MKKETRFTFHLTRKELEEAVKQYVGTTGKLDSFWIKSECLADPQIVCSLTIVEN